MHAPRLGAATLGNERGFGWAGNASDRIKPEVHGMSTKPWESGGMPSNGEP